MKITVGQFNVKSKDIKANYLAMQELIKEAINSDYEMIVFGEYSLSGYACADWFFDNNFYAEIEYYTEKLKRLSDKIVIVFGSIKKEADKRYVVASILYNQKEFTSYKENLNKREFSELKYFDKKENLSLMINDQEILFSFRSDFNESDKLKVVLDSSPVNHTLNFDQQNTVYANTLGISNSNKTVFINGGSSYININNKVISNARFNHYGLLEDFPMKKASILEELVYGIKVFSDSNFGVDKKWLLGNSGGLDSAVTLSLLSIALGSEKVISYNLRSKYNSDKTVNNAQSLAHKLKVKHYNVNIDEEVNSYLKIMNDAGYNEIDTLTYENIQARTRGHLLGGFSSLENAVISNNGNKLELALGYATLYGDTIGALSIIGDLLKIEVFELAKQINEYFNDEVVAHNLIPKVDNYTISFELAPSAELKDNQLDPMKWFYHDYLLDLVLTYRREDILSMYLDNQFKDLEISKWLDFYGLLNGEAFIEDFNWFLRTFEINHFKRLQTPPVLAYGNKVIGVDYLESMFIKAKSDRELELEKMIVAKYE